MIKALFFDLDGTLLNSKNKITLNTIKALQDCKSKGLKVFPTTGRPPLLDQMLHLSSEEKYILSDGGIFYNGGCICRKDSKEYNKISLETVEIVLSCLLNTKDINMVIQMSDEIHSFRFDIEEENLHLWGITKNHLSPFNLFNKMDVVKMYMFSRNWDIQLDNIYTELKKLIGDNASVYLTSGGRTIDIVGKDVSKKTGIEKVIKCFNISPSEVAVFGDDTNDLDMLSGFANSFAMGNAPDEVKAAARNITLSNDEDGIYHAIKNILCLI
jgi:HAD-superfamily hydrolase, subfamily IIB